MDYTKFWSIINHEKAVKECEGKTIQFNQNERARGNSGGWEKKAYIVTVEFVDSDRTLIRYADGQRRIVKTSDLMVL